MIESATRPQLRIRATGKYLPAQVVHSETLEAAIGLPAGWMAQRSGVVTRHWVTDEKPSYMGARALEQALASAGLAFEDLDLLICSAASYDYIIPFTACMIQREIGKTETGMPCFDIDATCLSFVAGLDVANAFITSGRYRRIAIVSAEMASLNLNPNDPETYSLLGDGAAAAIVEAANPGEESRVLNAYMTTHAAGAEYTILRAWGCAEHPAKCEPYPEAHRYFHMEGKHLLKFTFEKMPAFLEALYRPLSFRLQDTDLIIPHQASAAGLAYFKRMYQLKEEQVFGNLETHGNCISASIPMALHDAIQLGKIQRGQHLALMGTAAGVSLGGVVMVY